MKITNEDPRLLDVSKERLAVSRIEKGLDTHPMVILSGPRKVGKTTALLQLAVKNKNHEYINCNYEEDRKLLETIFYQETDILLLIDEIQDLPQCQTWVSSLYSKASRHHKFRVAITGSVAACLSVLATKSGGGGRSKHVHMPIISYLEYLHITGGVGDYGADLYSLDYKDTFNDYMRLKNAEWFSVGPINSDYIRGASDEIASASRNTGTPNNLLGSTREDIVNAFILLSYKMAQDWKAGITFNDPHVGALELGVPAGAALSFEELEQFSVLQAVKSLMTTEQIVKAIRYLLWNGIALYDYVGKGYGERAISDLTDISLDRGEIYTDSFLERMFSVESRVAVVNPLYYSALSDELFLLLSGLIRQKRKGEFTGIELFIRQKLSSRPDGFLKDGDVLGSWVECYLRGALSLMDPLLPLKCKRFRDASGREVDLVSDMHRVMVEVTVQKKNKTEKDVNFYLFREGFEPCLLVTRRAFGVKRMNGIDVMLIPYPMMAAFLDRGEFPELDYFIR